MRQPKAHRPGPFLAVTDPAGSWVQAREAPPSQCLTGRMTPPAGPASEVTLINKWATIARACGSLAEDGASGVPGGPKGGNFKLRLHRGQHPEQRMPQLWPSVVYQHGHGFKRACSL